MIQTWKDFFYFNKRERNGLLVVSFLISIVFTVKAFNKWTIADRVVPRKVNDQMNTFYSQSNDTVEKEVADSSDSMSRERRYARLMELNKVDTSHLLELQGVGSYYARQIVWYRERLGGYYSKEQLFEIPHMREETVLRIWDQLTLDTLLIRKIRLNSSERIDLVKHPYITWEMAKRIYEERRYGSLFESTHDLVRREIITVELFDRLKPYLSL